MILYSLPSQSVPAHVIYFFTMGNDIIGEWTDSKARSLKLAQDRKVIVCKENGDALYTLTAQEKVVDGEQISDTQVSLVMELQGIA